MGRMSLGAKGVAWLACAAVTAAIALSVHAAVDPREFRVPAGPSPISAAADDVMITGALPREHGERLRRVVDPAVLRNLLADYRAGRLTEADAGARDIRDPALRTLLEWVAVRSGSPRFERIDAFLKANTDWPGQPVLRRRAEEALWRERATPSVVLDFFSRGEPQGLPGRLALATALQAQNRAAEARAVAVAIWRQDNLASELEERVLKLGEGAITPSDHRVRMEAMLFDERWEVALRAAERLGPDFATLARARIAVVRRAGNAAKALEAVPAGLRADSSYAFSKAHHLRRQDKFVEAAKAMDGVSRDPAVLADGDAWWNERRLIARKLIDLDEPSLAYKVAAGHGATGAAARIEAEFHAGWIALRLLKDPATAGRHFAVAAGIAETPISLARANYWRGRAAEAMGAREEARLHYARAAGHPVAFYGQLARAKLGRNDLALRSPRPLDGPVEAAFQNRASVQGLYLLWELGETELMRTLFRDHAQSLAGLGEMAALGDVARRLRDPQATLAVGKIGLQRGFPLDVHAFPTFGVPRLDPDRQKAERALVHAIARQESAFAPEATSHAGARGLMQLMPATARETARRYAMPYEPEKLTGDPAYNVALGSAHVADLMRHWRGSLPLVIAAYNGGSGNVRKWIEAYGDPRSETVDPIDWIERIPFSETRDYVQRVLENLQVYRQRFGDQTALLTEADLRRATPSP